MPAESPRTYTDVNQYSEGKMVLDFVDTRISKLAFRGRGVALVGGPSGNSGKIEKAVEKIVAALPISTKR